MPLLLQIGLVHALLTAMLLLLGLLLSVVVFMLFYLVKKRNTERRKSGWTRSARLLVSNAVFFEKDDGKPGQTTPDSPKWAHIPGFRECLIDELVTAKKNLTGDAAANIVRLYRLLGLEKDSEQKLSSLKWHLKARGIQELALMEQKDQMSRIYRHTNNRNEFIRMEAQLAMVQLYGMEGLRFLDVVSEPISEWQQIKLLAHLPKKANEPLKGIRGWLQSHNPSVLAFSLKLVAIHHQFELHDHVAACLGHRDAQVRVHAAKCLREIYNENTPRLLIDHYQENGRAYKEAVLEALGAIGAESSVSFLRSALRDEDNSLKLLAARALTNLGRQGGCALDDFDLIGQYPWNEIIRQVKSEQTT
jgi:HEAT repeats